MEILEQYATADNLTTRMQIYEFAVKDQNLHHWIMSQIAPLAGEKILEVGCGNGILWQRALPNLPDQISVTCLDLSEGMLAVCQKVLPGDSFEFQQGDVQSLPFADDSFDRVIANHMLYHVPDIQRAFGEMKRVLRPGGHLHASTNSRDHLHQLRRLARTVFPDWDEKTARTIFDLETGPAKVAEFYTEVAISRLDNILEVTEAEAIVAYIGSLFEDDKHTFDALTSIRLKAENIIEQMGAFHIRTANGLITALRP